MFSYEKTTGKSPRSIALLQAAILLSQSRISIFETNFSSICFFSAVFCTVSLFSWLESLKNLPIVIFKCFCGENTNSVTLKNHNSFERSMLVWFRFRSLDQTSSFVQTLHYCLLAHHFVQTSHPLYTLCELHSATICCIFIHFTLMLYYVT